jgi:hypothetical protein
MAPGDATMISTPESTGNYRLHVLDGAGQKLSVSEFLVRVQ